MPDSLVQLTKTKFKNRILAMHQETPFQVIEEDFNTDTLMSNTAVTEMAGSWYDEFVVKNSG